MDINDIIKAVMAGAAQQGGMLSSQGAPRVPGLEIPSQDSTPPGTPSAGADNMGAVLGSILGAAPQSGVGISSGGANDPLGAILGGLLGGGAPQHGRPIQQPPTSGGGGIGDILGAVIGGGGSYAANNSLLAPIADILAQKLGIAPSLALIVVSFAMSKLLAAHANGGAHGNLQLQQIMGHMDSDQGVPTKYLHSTGMPQELARATGLDQNKAAQALQQAFNLIGDQVGSGGVG